MRKNGRVRAPEGGSPASNKWALECSANAGPAGVSVTLALPVTASPASTAVEPPFRVDPLPGTKALRFTHQGPYAELANTYGRITAFMIEKRWMDSEADWARYMPMWEEYRNDPAQTPAGELLTYIYLPLR